MQKSGYVKIYVPNHPAVLARGPKSTDRCLYEHRIVWERRHKRWTRRGESIHHKDGNRSNNHPDNLELWTRNQPAGRRVWDILKRKVASAARNVPHLAHIRAVIYLLLEHHEALVIRCIVRSGRWKIAPREKRRKYEEVAQRREARMRRLQQARQRHLDSQDEAPQGLPG